MKHIPFAIQYGKKMRERGYYSTGEGPMGCVVHTTDGHFEKGLASAVQVIEHGILKATRISQQHALVK